MKPVTKMKKFAMLMSLGILLGGTALGNCAVTSTSITAQAQENTQEDDRENAFYINAEFLSADKTTYNIRVTVDNAGADWEGTVRLQVDEGYCLPCAYDTAITLPQGSTKQFVLKVPADNLTNSGTDGTVQVFLLDKKNQKVAEQDFSKLLQQDTDVLSLGILSDNYADLTYLDMGGEKQYFYGDYYPIRLIELNQDNLMDTLENLDFLVIDRYHTDVLTQEERDALSQWNDDGGVLIIGTGSYAEDTLAAFDYLGVTCSAILTAQENEYYNPAQYSEADLTQLALAVLTTTGSQYDDDNYSGVLACSMGDGAVGILPYSLEELGRMGEEFFEDTNQEGVVGNIYDAVSVESQSRYWSGSQRYVSVSDNLLYRQRFMNLLSSCDNVLNFALLKWLVVLYVILVGPVLYLILKLMKKRELYWLAVPVTALAGIILIFFAGRGFEVVSTRVYSVAVKNLSDGGQGVTFMHCYDAGHREWKLRLAEGYEYAGAMVNDTYYYDGDDSYYHHIKKEGDRLYFGINPSSNFEDGYFCAGIAGDEQTADSSIIGENISVGWTGPEGEITNGTQWDFLYFAVCTEDALYVYENLPAGESCNLSDRELVYGDSQSSDFVQSYIYNEVRDVYQDDDMEKTAHLSALGMGLCSVYSQMTSGDVVIVGLVEDWEKAVDDNCSEVSYGCLYAVQ